MRQNNYKLSKLYDAQGDVNKRWYVYYYLKNPATNKMVRFRQFISQKIKSAKDRYATGEEMMNIIDKNTIIFCF